MDCHAAVCGAPERKQFVSIGHHNIREFRHLNGNNLGARVEGDRDEWATDAPDACGNLR